MEFFVDNWLWFLVGAIIILMTLIGYIAEKTDFGRKDMSKVEKTKKPKKEKKKKESKANQESTEVLEVEEPKAEIQMSLATDSILEETGNQDLKSNTETLENLNVPFGDVMFEESVNEVDMPTVTEEMTYEQPMEDLNNSVSLEYDEPAIELQTTTDVTDDLNVPFGDVTFEEPVNVVEEVVEAEPVQEVNYVDVETPNIDLPDLNSIVTEQEDSDDVWKF